MKKISRRNFLKVSGAMAAAGALAACGGSGASTPAASGAASTSTAASAAAAGEDKFASLGDFTMTVGHAQPEGNPALFPWSSLPPMWQRPPTAM